MTTLRIGILSGARPDPNLPASQPTIEVQHGQSQQSHTGSSG